MTLEPTEEQTLLRDTVSRFLGDHVAAGDAARVPLSAGDWRALGELGVLALAVPESAGGLGGGALEIMLVCEAMGRAGAMTPMADVGVLSALTLADAADAKSFSALLATVLSGEALVAFAEAGEGFGSLAVTPCEGGWRLDGERRLVRHGDIAETVIVDTADDTLGLALVQATTQGLNVTPYRLVDGQMAARLSFDGVVLPSSACMAVSPAARDRALALARLAVLAEMVGLMQALYEATIDHVRQRRQFGVAIGSFQVIQHRAARLFIGLEQSRSMMLRAAHDPGDDFDKKVTEAQAYVGEAALRLAQDATQLHGGMGVTDELFVGRAHRRILTLSRAFGGTIGARARLAV